jgi:putative ATP-binding cassette transporter
MMNIKNIFRSNLLAFLGSESPKQFRQLLGLSVSVGIVNTLVVGLINAASSKASNGEDTTLFFFLFASLLCFFYFLTNRSNAENIKATQDLIYRFKLRILQDVYTTDLMRIDAVGRSYIAEVMVRDSQLVSQSLVVIVTTFQSLATLFFLTIYLSTISILASLIVLSSLFVIFTVSIREIGLVTEQFNQVSKDETEVNSLYMDFLYGFKEVKMNSSRAYDLTEELMAESNAINDKKSQLTISITNFFNTLQIFLYVVVGVMVFVVPVFSESFAVNVPTAATTALFLAASLTGIISSIPGLSQADVAAKSLRELARKLEGESVKSIDEVRISALEIKSIELNSIEYIHSGSELAKSFSLGPISYRFDAGKVYFIRGKNGSGKTTLMRLLLGLYQVSSGQIIVNNTPSIAVGTSDYRDLFSVVFNDFHLFRKLYGIYTATDVEIDRLIRLFQMESKLTVRNNVFSDLQFSTGQRKRIALIVAMLENKPIVVLDEWAADQDPLFRKKFYQVIVPMLRDEGKTVIAITHDDQYFSSADYVINMDSGKIVEEDVV